MRYLGACPSEKEMVEQILPDVRLKLECCAVLCWIDAASRALHVAVSARQSCVACCFAAQWLATVDACLG